MIFSIFGKKDKPSPSSPEKSPSLKRSEKESGRDTEAARASSVQRRAAQATALKIDAIESEMSSEFVNSTRANTITGPATQPPKPVPSARPARPKADATSTFSPTLSQSTLGTSTLHGDTLHGVVALAHSESAPAIEEAAILFANDQIEVAEHALQAAIHDDSLGHATIYAWKMLFDLYQITGRQADFDQLSIEYASKFETSPPSWVETATDANAEPSQPTRSSPIVPFSGKLDGTIMKQLERAQNLATKNQALRLEFAKVTEVDPIGCGILLSVLKKLQKSGNDLILVGALDLVGKIKSILEVGRRDETEAPWLLMLELLRLLNMEKDFEEASIDYCVTFEVSPPPFIAPKNKVTTALDEKADEEESGAEHFMMPAVIEGKVDSLVSSIDAYSIEHPLTILDCSRLNRIDFSSAGQLLTSLAPLAAKGVTIEFHAVNHLVAALMQTMGMHDMFRIELRKS